MLWEGRDVNVPISEADLVFVDSGGEVGESSSGKEPEEDEEETARRRRHRRRCSDSSSDLRGSSGWCRLLLRHRGLESLPWMFKGKVSEVGPT